MHSIKYFFYTFLLAAMPAVASAEDCRCIEISAPVVNKEKSMVTFNVTNSCIRRVWFSTKGFWINVSQEQGSKTESKLSKLDGEHPKFLLFKWKSTKQITFHSDQLKGDYDKVNFSYSNTTDSQPRNMLSAKTYLCEVDIK